MAEMLPSSPPPLRPAASTQQMRPAADRVLLRGHVPSYSKGEHCPQRDPAALGSAMDREVVRSAAARAVVRGRRRHGRCLRDLSTRRFGDNLSVGYSRDRWSSLYDADFVLSSIFLNRIMLMIVVFSL